MAGGAGQKDEEATDQLGLFAEEPAAKPSLPEYRAFLVCHQWGYTPQKPCRQLLLPSGDGTYAGELRAARKARKNSRLAYHIEIEKLDLRPWNKLKKLLDAEA